jgi:hypothetical protein
MMLNLALADFAAREGALDYAAVTPDMFWLDRGPSPEGASPDHPFHGPARYPDLAPWTAMLEACGLPQVSHHIGLSMASTVPADPAYIAQMDRWARRWNAHWLSEHLAFVAIQPADGPGAAGLALTAPFDHEVLDLVVARARQVMDATGRPFLLENSPYFVDFPDSDMDEAEFLNRFCARSGAGLLLDLHNLHCNAVNYGFSGHAFLDRLDLANVVEVHIAGGAELAGMWADAHAGAPPEPVWDLLEDCAARSPNLRGITFEFHDSYLPVLGLDGVEAVIARARGIWHAHVAPRLAPAPA